MGGKLPQTMQSKVATPPGLHQELTRTAPSFQYTTNTLVGGVGALPVRGVSAVLKPATLCIIILLHETIFPRLAMQCIVRKVAAEIKRANNFSRNVRSRDDLQCVTCFL